MKDLGYCPVCGSEGVTRERRLNGDDTCIKGHKYPSKDAISTREESILPVVRKRLEDLLRITSEGVILELLRQRRQEPEKWKNVPGFGRETNDNGKFK